MFCFCSVSVSMSLAVVVCLMLMDLSYLRPGLCFVFCVCTVPGVMRSQSINNSSEIRILKQLFIQIKTLYLIFLSLFFFFAYPAKNPLKNKTSAVLPLIFQKKNGKRNLSNTSHQCNALFIALFN